MKKRIILNKEKIDLTEQEFCPKYRYTLESTRCAGTV